MAVDGLRRTYLAQVVLWTVIAAYGGWLWSYSHDSALVKLRLMTAVGLAVLAYAIVLFSGTAPPLPSTNDQEDAELESLRQPRMFVKQSAADLTRLSNEIQKISAGIGELSTAVTEMVKTVSDTMGAVVSEVTDTTTRLRKDAESLRPLTETMLRTIAGVPSVAGLAALHPTPPPADPKLVSSAAPYVQALLASQSYRRGLLELASNFFIVDAIETQFRSLLQRSSDLYAASVVMRGPLSPRMQDWFNTNIAARDSLYAIGPLLRRLRRVSVLDGGDSSIEEFLGGLTGREMRAIGFMLEENAAAVTNDRQVKTALRRVRESLVRQWLTPTVRLYQLIHEALPIEDPALHERAMALAAPHDARDRGHPSDIVQAAAESLGYRYVHHELYTVDPYQMQGNLSVDASRHTFRQWTEGDIFDERLSVHLGRDSLGRVITPRFEHDNQRLDETEIIMILKDPQ